jgi:hypothetical protein
MAEFNQLGHFQMGQRSVLLAVARKVPDVVLSRRLGHEHASFYASGVMGACQADGHGLPAGHWCPCRSGDPMLPGFVDFRMAGVNRDTDLDFLG